MQIATDTQYVLKDGTVVTFKQNNLPYYKFSCATAYKDGKAANFLKRECWREDGIAYHDDCGYSVSHQLI